MAEPMERATPIKELVLCWYLKPTDSSYANKTIPAIASITATNCKKKKKVEYFLKF